MKTLYEQKPEAWEKVAEHGAPCVAEMAKHFTTHQDMDNALGYIRASKNWSDRGGSVGAHSESKAHKWLAANKKHAQPPVHDAPTGQMFLVIATPEQAARAQKVLSLIGCEFVEV